MLYINKKSVDQFFDLIIVKCDLQNLKTLNKRLTNGRSAYEP